MPLSIVPDLRASLESCARSGDVNPLLGLFNVTLGVRSSRGAQSAAGINVRLLAVVLINLGSEGRFGYGFLFVSGFLVESVEVSLVSVLTVGPYLELVIHLGHTGNFLDGGFKFCFSCSLFTVPRKVT